MLVDHHCHLDFPQFDGDRSAIVARAREAGVGILVTISTRVRQIEKLLEICAEHRGVFCSVGTHPHHADEECDITVEELVELSQHARVVAIGEAGLDYFYQKSSRDGQAEGLRRHIKAARETGLPLEIHSRDADEDMARILENEYRQGPFKAILHCFTGGHDLARRAVAMGMLISFTGIITFKNSDTLREVASKIPLDNLLVETDAPYLAPTPHRSKTNEPAFVNYTAETLAAVKGVSVEKLAEATTSNFFRTFTKVPRTAVQRAGAA
ncbi:MAG: TatD family hydrolase [Hyphomicrobiaceae bacterium]